MVAPPWWPRPHHRHLVGHSDTTATPPPPAAVCPQSLPPLPPWRAWVRSVAEVRQTDAWRPGTPRHTPPAPQPQLDQGGRSAQAPPSSRQPRGRPTIGSHCFNYRTSLCGGHVRRRRVAGRGLTSPVCSWGHPGRGWGGAVAVKDRPAPPPALTPPRVRPSWRSASRRSAASPARLSSAASVW